MKTVGALTIGRLERQKRRWIPIVEAKKYEYLVECERADGKNKKKFESELIDAICTLLSYDSVRQHVEAYFNESSNPKDDKVRLLKAYKHSVALDSKAEYGSNKRTLKAISYGQYFKSLLEKSGYDYEKERAVMVRYIKSEMIPDLN